MESDTGWITYRNDLCKPVETDLLGYPVQNKERLISAIISNALLNEAVPFQELKKIKVDTSLETMGDFILDFLIFDNFALKGHYTAKEIDNFRQLYGGNDILHCFSKKCIKLQDFILWGSDEIRLKKWNQRNTELLADRFEMLIAVIYLENGIDAVKNFLKKHNFFEEIDTIKTNKECGFLK